MAQNKKEKELKVRFCPRCRSFQVRYIHGLRNVFGVIPKQRCMDCGLEAAVFPLLITTPSNLKKTVADMKKKSTPKKKKKVRRSIKRT